MKKEIDKNVLNNNEMETNSNLLMYANNKLTTKTKRERY